MPPNNVVNPINCYNINLRTISLNSRKGKCRDLAALVIKENGSNSKKLWVLVLMGSNPNRWSCFFKLIWHTSVFAGLWGSLVFQICPSLILINLCSYIESVLTNYKGMLAHKLLSKGLISFFMGNRISQKTFYFHSSPTDLFWIWDRISPNAEISFPPKIFLRSK